MYNIYIDQDVIRCDLNFRAQLFDPYDCEII
jgi:hypothetical protein